MNSKLNSHTLRSLLSAGLVIGAVTTASAASTVLTFNVDMSSASFDPTTQTVSVHGTFDGWGAGIELTNSNPGGPGVWSTTTNVPLNGVVVAYKYVIDQGGVYEGIYQGANHNRLIALPATSGSSFTAPLVYFGDTPPAMITNEVTFQVNMDQQIQIGAYTPGTSVVELRGLYFGWASTVGQTNDPSIQIHYPGGVVTTDVYTNTYEVIGSPGQTMDYKYHIDFGNPLDDWESPAPGTGDPSDNNNRFFNLGAGPTQTLPIVSFNDSPYSTVRTNDVTFQVDMSSQYALGFFDASTSTVELRGNFNSWGNPVILCTNDPTAINTNLFKTVVKLVDGIGATEQYKFWASGITANGGWETMGPNRTMQIVDGTAQTLPPVYFDDNYVDPTDLLPADTTVTFSVSMTNAVGTDLHVFDPSSDNVVINGIPATNGIPAFIDWTLAPVLANNPVPSRIYTLDILLPRGSYVQQAYKYGIDGINNEPGTNHVRYIRSTGNYVMPLDTFGNIVIEPSFGNLTVAPPVAGHVLVSWLGRPGVHLQTATSLGGSWTDHLDTDALNQTNWPVSGTSVFFRLVKP